MIEQIKEYLKSNDIETIGVGLELLNTSDILRKDRYDLLKSINGLQIKRKIKHFSEGYSIEGPDGLYRRSNTMIFDPVRNRFSNYTYIGPIELSL